jgi:ABC-type branched-subunit amino acid transport system substrate-binding protein
VLSQTQSLNLGRWAAIAVLTLAATHAFADNLIVGQVAELSGQEVVAENVAGARLWFDHVNKSSPDANQYVLKQYDDKRDPKLTVEFTRKLVTQDNAIALFGYRSTPSLDLLSKELDAMNIAMVAPFNGSESVRKNAKNAFFLRGTYKDEARRLVDQLASVGIRKVALVYQQDPFGKEGLEAYQTALKARGIEAATVLDYDRKTLDVSGTIAELLKQEPAATLMACTPKACASIINGVRAKNTSMLFGVLSNAVNAEFTKAVSQSGRGVMMSQVMPYPWNVASPIVREFNRINALAGNSTPVSYASLEGFAAARLLTEAVRRTGAKPTRAGVLTALRGMKSFDLGGIFFNPEGRHYFTEVTTMGKDGKIVR